MQRTRTYLYATTYDHENGNLATAAVFGCEQRGLQLISIVMEARGPYLYNVGHSGSVLIIGIDSRSPLNRPPHMKTNKRITIISTPIYFNSIYNGSWLTSPLPPLRVLALSLSWKGAGIKQCVQSPFLKCSPPWFHIIPPPAYMFATITTRIARRPLPFKAANAQRLACIHAEERLYVNESSIGFAGGPAPGIRGSFFVDSGCGPFWECFDRCPCMHDLLIKSQIILSISRRFWSLICANGHPLSYNLYSCSSHKQPPWQDPIGSFQAELFETSRETRTELRVSWFWGGGGQFLW